MTDQLVRQAVNDQNRYMIDRQRERLRDRETENHRQIDDRLCEWEMEDRKRNDKMSVNNVVQEESEARKVVDLIKACCSMLGILKRKGFKNVITKVKSVCHL